MSKYPLRYQTVKGAKVAAYTIISIRWLLYRPMLRNRRYKGITTTTGESIWNTRIRNIQNFLPTTFNRDSANAEGSETRRISTTDHRVIHAEFCRF